MEQKLGPSERKLDIEAVKTLLTDPRDIENTKFQYLELLSLLDKFRTRATNPVAIRKFSVAITELETSQYFALDALSI